MPKRGEIILFDSGNYSDYTVDGLVRVVKPFNKGEEYESFLRLPAPPGAYWSRTFEGEPCENIIEYLRRRGLVEDVDHLWWDTERAED